MFYPLIYVFDENELKSVFLKCEYEDFLGWMELFWGEKAGGGSVRTFLTPKPRLFSVRMRNSYEFRGRSSYYSFSRRHLGEGLTFFFFSQDWTLLREASYPGQNPIHHTLEDSETPSSSFSCWSSLFSQFWRKKKKLTLKRIQFPSAKFPLILIPIGLIGS